MFQQHAFERMWSNLKNDVRLQWAELTDDDVDRIAGKRDVLLERLKERYGLTYERIDREVAEFELNVTCAARNVPRPLGIGNDWGD